jgi:hypothetical protein
MTILLGKAVPLRQHDDNNNVVPASRVSFAHVQGVEEVFTVDFLRYVVELHDRFANRIVSLRQRRKVQNNTMYYYLYVCKTSCATWTMEHWSLPAQWNKRLIYIVIFSGITNISFAESIFRGCLTECILLYGISLSG